MYRYLWCYWDCLIHRSLAFSLLCLEPWVFGETWICRLCLPDPPVIWLPDGFSQWEALTRGGWEMPGHFSPFFTVLGGISSSSDVPSIASFPAVQDCGTHFFRMTSVPGIQEHHILSSTLLPQDSSDLMLLIPQLPHCSLFGLWAPSLSLKPMFYIKFPLLWILRVFFVFLIML